jgi:hypothetical protein
VVLIDSQLAIDLHLDSAGGSNVQLWGKLSKSGQVADLREKERQKLAAISLLRH